MRNSTCVKQDTGIKNDALYERRFRVRRIETCKLLYVNSAPGTAQLLWLAEAGQHRISTGGLYNV